MAPPRSRGYASSVVRWAIRGAVAIVVLEVLLALGATVLGFDYAIAMTNVTLPTPLWRVVLVALVTGSLVLMAAREAGAVYVGVVVGALVALADATIGWAIVWAAGPGTPDFFDAIGADDISLLVAQTIAAYVVLGAGIGFVAGLVARQRPIRDA